MRVEGIIMARDSLFASSKAVGEIDMKLDNFLQDGHTYFRLFVRCPSCIEQGKSASSSYIEHGENDCHGEMYVGDNAYFKCKKCGCTAPIENWEFSCPVCSGSSVSSLKKGNMGPGFAISFAGQLVSECGLEWFMKLMGSLTDHLEE